MLLSALAGLIPVITGMLVLYWQVDTSLQRDSLSAGQRAIVNIERTIERADDLAARASGMAGGDCSKVLDDMRRMAVGYPLVRSIVLGNTEGFYCGSELGEVFHPHSIETAAMDKLLLRTASLPSPDQASMLFSRYEGVYSINAVIDAEVLAQGLKYAANGADVLLESNGVFLDQAGKVVTYNFDDHGDHHAVQVSSHYGFRIHSGFAPGRTVAAFQGQAFSMLGTLLLLGVLTAGVCHWLACKRRGSQA